MKLTLQLVVVVINGTTKFRDNLFKFTVYTIIIYKVGDTRCHNRNVIITYRFLAAPIQANRDFFYIDCMTVYLNCTV